MVQRLLTGGADRSRLPDEARLARYRELSNRRHAVDMLAYLCGSGSDLGQKWRVGFVAFLLLYRRTGNHPKDAGNIPKPY